jgi:hypothetical protein
MENPYITRLCGLIGVFSASKQKINHCTLFSWGKYADVWPERMKFSLRFSQEK